MGPCPTPVSRQLLRTSTPWPPRSRPRCTRESQRGIRCPSSVWYWCASRPDCCWPHTAPRSCSDGSAGPARREGPDGLLRNKYRGQDPEHPENIVLLRAYEQRPPLMWFVGITPGVYLPRYPVSLIANEPEFLQFVVAIDEAQRLVPATSPLEEELRGYMRRLTNQRLHQPIFRARVLHVYETRCAIYKLGYAQLLDAAHILPDKHPRGRPAVLNRLAFCKIHHAAFDQNILGVRPDLYVEVRQDILEEIDGPMLRHGFKRRLVCGCPSHGPSQPDSTSWRSKSAMKSFGLPHERVDARVGQAAGWKSSQGVPVSINSSSQSAAPPTAAVATAQPKRFCRWPHNPYSEECGEPRETRYRLRHSTGAVARFGGRALAGDV